MPSLPDFLQPFFWDVDFQSLRWEQQRDFIAQRILQAGSWQAVCWLRERMGDAELRAWLLRHHGARLEPRRWSFWQVILELPPRTVRRWVAEYNNNPWANR
jgi:hypothetical protein